MSKVAGYVRVSTEQQRENDSHIRQRERIQSWADDRDHDIDIYEDIAISGQSDKREQYNILMGDPSKDELGKVVEYDIFLVRELSRMGRSLQNITKNIELMSGNNVDFVSLKEDLDLTSAQGKLMMHIIAAFNQFWADWARERALEYVEHARENDEPLGRPKKLNEEQREQVREWHEMGLGYRSIVPLVDDAWGIQVDASTIYRYCKDGDGDE